MLDGNRYESTMRLNGRYNAVHATEITTSFDAFTCHLFIVAVRYMMISVYQRANTDDRSLGELFSLITEEVEQTSFQHVFAQILEPLVETVIEYFKIPSEQINQFVALFIEKLPGNIKSALSSFTYKEKTA